MQNRFLAIALVVGLAGVALAEVVYDSNKPLMSAPAAVLANPISSADAGVYDPPVRPRLTNNCSKVIVSPTFSVQSATACIEIVIYQRASGPTDTYATIAAVQTISSTSLTTAQSGRYPSRDGFILAPTLGCQVYDVRLRSISSGNVTWSSWPLGSDTAPSPATNQ